MATFPNFEIANQELGVKYWDFKVAQITDSKVKNYKIVMRKKKVLIAYRGISKS